LTLRPAVSEASVTPSLLREVQRFGKFDSRCFNCGSCTVTCELTGDSASFPRRPLQYAVVGLQNRLDSSLEPWLCYDCGDCSKSCPQQAEPRESLATLRRYLTARYDWTGLSSKIYRSRAWAIGSLLFAGGLVLALIAAYHLLVVGMQPSDFTSRSLVLKMGLEHQFPTIVYFTLVVVLLPVLVLLSNVYRMHRFAMSRAGGVRVPPSLYLSELKSLVLDTVTQKRMKDCPDETHKKRWTGHFLMAAGCGLMLVIVVFFLRWFQTDAPYPVFHPQRWLGYLITAALVYGTVAVLKGRAKKEELYKNSEFTDYTFPVLLFLAAATGIAVHLFRYMDNPLAPSGLTIASRYAYAIHIIVTTPLLVVELPFGKWSHAMYRPLARYFHSVMEKAVSQQRQEQREAA
jgi:nitrate reductase gamma subunit